MVRFEIDTKTGEPSEALKGMLSGEFLGVICLMERTRLSKRWDGDAAVGEVEEAEEPALVGETGGDTPPTASPKSRLLFRRYSILWGSSGVKGVMERW